MKTKHTAQQQSASVLRAVSLTDMNLTPADVMSVGGSDRCISQYVRALRQNWRQGTVSCKDRSEVARTNKKPFKQKGTGNARAGSARSPLWRGGGVIFGPQARVRKLSIPQQMRAIAMRTLVGDLVLQGRVHQLAYEIPQNELPKTAIFARMFAQAGVEGKKVVLLTTRDDQFVHASCSNIPGVRLYLFDQLNAYALADADCVIYLAKDHQMFERMVQAWI